MRSPPNAAIAPAVWSELTSWNSRERQSEVLMRAVLNLDATRPETAPGCRGNIALLQTFQYRTTIFLEVANQATSSS